MVGSCLGEALTGLLHSMHEFRSHLGDNVDDIMDYMDEEGYLDIIDQPNHALAVLHFAESFQMNDLYIRAFAHCVGMADQMYASPEYEHISLESRKLLRKSRIDMECRLYSASDKLRNFLDDELSETHLGLPSGARAHLERFRSFLLSYYATRLGYYPPRSFKPSLYGMMRDDFEALYGFLVDESYSIHGGLPSVAVGGICTIQLIQSIDHLHHYDPLEHPLPLLPNISAHNSKTWSSWRPRLDKTKMRPDERRIAHTSLIKASNWKEEIFRNDLVRACRTFEEEIVMAPNKADKQEKVSVADARKVRWMMVYATYQVLRSVTEIPSEVHDAEGAEYHVAISTKNLPPWDDEIQFDCLLRRQTDLALWSSLPIVWADSAGVESNSNKIEIKPDIDYFALARQQEQQQANSAALELTSPVGVPTRTSSLTQSLSRNATIRRSMRLFRPSTTPPPQTPSLSRPVYHEIVVHGYGNGTNAVHMEPETSQSSTSESSSPPALSDSSQTSSESGETLDDSIKTLSPIEQPQMDLYFPVEVKPLKTRRREVVSMMADPVAPIPPPKSLRRPRSVSLTPSHNDVSKIYEELVEEQRRTFLSDESPSTGYPLGRRVVSKPELRIHTDDNDSFFTRTTSTLKKRHTLQPQHIMEDDWLAMQAFMDGERPRVADYDDDDTDVQPAWEQYADLGGLTEMR